jgi:hypothetical protein
MDGIDEIDKITLQKIIDHYPAGSEITLQVLKGHLILEETLRDLLDALLVNPEALCGERGTSLTSHQVICLAHALAPIPYNSYSWLWVSAKQLNSLRNDMAHKLAPPDMEKKLNSFISTVMESDPELGINRSQFPTLEAKFAACTGVLCGIFSNIKRRTQSARLGA